MPNIRMLRHQGDLFASVEDVITWLQEMETNVKDGKTPEGEEGGVGVEAQNIRAGSRGAFHATWVKLRELAAEVVGS